MRVASFIIRWLRCYRLASTLSGMRKAHLLAWKQSLLWPLMPPLWATIPTFVSSVVKQFDLHFKSGETQMRICEKASSSITVYPIHLSTHIQRSLTFFLAKAVTNARDEFVDSCPHLWWCTSFGSEVECSWMIGNQLWLRRCPSCATRIDFVSPKFIVFKSHLHTWLAASEVIYFWLQCREQDGESVFYDAHRYGYGLG